MLCLVTEKLIMKNYNHFISVVIPIYNEEENLPLLTERLVNVLSQYSKFEVIYVDDGSKDRSTQLIKEHSQKHPQIKLIKLSRNFGHQEAITAGLNYASGDAVIVMDGDLQDPPEVLPQFVDKWQEGYDVVYAIREKRKENFLKKFAYYCFYRLLRYLASIDIPLDSGDFSLMDRKVVKLLNQIPEKNRFVRGIRSWLGFRQVGLAYERQARHAGVPKYTITKLFLLAYNGLTSFSTKPVKVASQIGMFFTFISFLGMMWILYHKLVLQTEVIQGWASTIFVVFFMSGVQLIIMGIQGEYIGRIFNEVKNRPNFIVGESIGFDEQKQKSEERDVA
ncbi:MAG: glycosyltransferase family 2 protein [Bdellovibrio sp.]